MQSTCCVDETNLSDLAEALSHRISMRVMQPSRRRFLEVSAWRRLPGAAIVVVLSTTNLIPLLKTIVH